MAFSIKSIDEEVAGIVDSYDGMIAPKTVWRNNNNKLYLTLKSIGAGFSKIRDVVLALKYRFDPRYCDDDDLASAMFITGEKTIPGKASMLRVIVTNTSIEEDGILFPGKYVYTSAEGQPFSFTAPENIVVPPQGFQVLLFSSRDIGAWAVAGELLASVVREDGQAISGDLEFEVFDNSSALGRLAETPFDIRQRILSDASRQDVLYELELAIKALPTIFECTLIFNSDNENTVTIEDGTVLQPKELLVVLTGVPNQDVADLVMSRTFYKTHMNTMEEVIWYYNPLLATGRYPVYFMFHKQRQFYLAINYLYDRQKMTKAGVETAFRRILRKYRFMTQHISEISEPLIYAELQNHGIPGVALRKVFIQIMTNGSLESVARVPIPRLMMPQLVDISFIAEEE